MFEIEILKLENEMNEKRLDIARNYCYNNNMRTDILTDNDLMSIYTMLSIKAKNFKKKTVDKIIK